MIFVRSNVNIKMVNIASKYSQRIGFEKTNNGVREIEQWCTRDRVVLLAKEQEAGVIPFVPTTYEEDLVVFLNVFR